MSCDITYYVALNRIRLSVQTPYDLTVLLKNSVLRVATWMNQVLNVKINKALKPVTALTTFFLALRTKLLPGVYRLCLP